MNIVKTLLKTLLLLAALGYLVFALVKVSRPTDEMVCTGTELLFADSGAVNLIDKATVEKYLVQHKISPKGRRLADIDIRGIEHTLADNPYVDTVTCYHTASGKLCIRIKPLHPIAHVFAQDGDEFYIDDKGTVMPAGGLNADLIVVTGHASRQFVAKRLLPLCRFLSEDVYWNRQTEQVNITPKGEVEIIPRYAQQRILLGEPKNFVPKLERVRLFYEKAMPKTGWNKYNTINATYEGQIICTKDKQ